MRGHGDEGRANQAGEDRVLDFEHAFDFVPTVSRGIETGGDEIRQMKSALELGDLMEPAGNGRVKQTERDERAPDHDRSLNQIGPDDGLDSAERGVNRGENDNGDGRADINPECLRLVRANAADHFVSEGERDGRDIQPRAGREQARDHEHGRRGILGRDTETRGQVFVDRVNFVVVIRLDENVADENAREDGAEGELHVSVIAQREAFAGRPEKSAGARFRGDDGSEHGPPRDAPAAEREVFQVVFLPAHAQADEDDDEEIEKQNRAIDGEPGVHVDLR